MCLSLSPGPLGWVHMSDIGQTCCVMYVNAIPVGAAGYVPSFCKWWSTITDFGLALTHNSPPLSRGPQSAVGRDQGDYYGNIVQANHGLYQQIASFVVDSLVKQ